MPWRWVAVLVLLAGAIGGATGAAVTLLRGDDDDGPVRGTLVHLGSPDYLASFTPQPFCVELHHFCIAHPETGHPVALYTYDPHPLFRGMGCEVRWQADAGFQNGPVTIHGLFTDPCGGFEYDSSGRRVFGPSPRDLDTFPVEVTDAGTIVDTRRLICGQQRLEGTYACERAPLGD
jgi:hypothetical protein